MNNTYSECAPVAIFIQHAKRMRHIILPSVACPAVQYVTTLSHERYVFRREKKYVIAHKIRVFFTTFLLNISHYNQK